ncbi:MAG: C25 family cysteine peptidase, partial [bacterium]|nr:C25 family cysteine peptidase [bacterium]
YGNWRQKILFLASPEPMFENISEELANQYVPPYFEVYRRYPSSGSPDYKYRTDDIVGNFNEGRIILHFTGHGGGYVWESGRMDLERHGVEVVPDNRDFFGFKNIAQLYNDGKYSLVIALTCYTGVFDNLKDDSLGEVLLKTPNAGAIAVISATWRSYVSSNDAFDRAMFSQMFRKNIRRIGDVFLNAKREINIPETSATYILLGDPATLLSFPQDTVRLQAVRVVDPNNWVQIYGTLNRKYKAKGMVVVKTEKGKIITEKDINLNNQNTFTIKIQIPTSYSQDTLVAYCYLWNEKAEWDAIGFTSVPGILIDSTKREKTVAMPQYLSALLLGAIPNSTVNVARSKTNEFSENEAEKKAHALFGAGETYYQQKDLLNAFLKYSESFQSGNRNPKLIQRLKQIVVPIETFETVTSVQISPYKHSRPAQIVKHNLTNELAYSGKKSEVFALIYPESCWFDYWGKDIDIPLEGPIGVRLYTRSTVLDTQLSLMVMVSFGTTHRVVFCSQLTRLGLNRWLELKIDDLYQVAKKRALSQDDNVGDIKVYPELLISHCNLDAGPIWDIDDMRIRKIGFNTGGKPGQFWIDDIELFFPQYKLEYYQ